MNIWRGTALILEKSHLYQRGRVLRHPLNRVTVATTNSQKAAEKYCVQNGYAWILPPSNVNLSKLEARI
jgi:hypothetical protein